MPEIVLEEIREKIAKRHTGDDSQLKVIFSDQPRILVEAPAGYGKTNTMVSKIAYLLSTQSIPDPKRILALTFSVNAAYKIKKDITQQLPDLLGEINLSNKILNKIIVSNYHGFCRFVLRKYGYLVNARLREVDKLTSIDDRDTKTLMQNVRGLLYEDADCMSTYSSHLKQADINYIQARQEAYNSIVTRDLLPQGIITFNAILSLTISLFLSHPNILDFYQKYFSALIVDEYQDTN
jgi:DNA helicase II / ATP-dependent DNA helicase PcrA